jgi:hypothetical protein
MINFNTFDGIIYDWVTKFTDLTVVWANQSGVKVDLPFIMMNKNTLINLGHGYISPIYLDDDDNGFQSIVDFCELTINFQSFGSNSQGELHKIKTLSSNHISQDELLKKGISLVNDTGIQNLTGLLDTQYQERASMDLVFRFTIIYDDIETSYIDNMKVGIQYKTGYSTIESTINIETE